MKRTPQLDFPQLIKLLIHLIKMLLPFFIRPASRRLITRLLSALSAIHNHASDDNVAALTCTMVRPAIDDTTHADLESIRPHLAPDLPWKKILEILIKLLQMLLEFFTPEPDDDNDVPPHPQHDLVKYTSHIARVTVAPEELALNKQKLADILEDHADWCSSNLCPDCTTARETARRLMTTYLAENAECWYGFSNGIEAALDEIASMGKLEAPADYNTAYRHIAEGLRKA